MPNSLIFIGERPSQKEMHIKGKPEFYDAVLLSKRSHQLSSILSYHSIPLHQAHISIHIRENNSYLNCQKQSLQLIEGEKQLSEEEAYDFFSNFAIMEDNKVAFLMRSRKKEIRPGEKVDPKVLSVSEKLEV
jgi:hypothetical protein